MELARGMNEQLEKYGPFHVIGAYHSAWTSCIELHAKAEADAENLAAALRSIVEASRGIAWLESCDNLTEGHNGDWECDGCSMCNVGYEIEHAEKLLLEIEGE